MKVGPREMNTAQRNCPPHGLDDARGRLFGFLERLGPHREAESHHSPPPRNRLRFAVGGYAALVVLGLAGQAWAAEGEAGITESADESNPVEEASAEPRDADRETERPPRPPVARDVFVPSEEISEDVEVPFPVDI